MNIDTVWDIYPWLSWTVILTGILGPLAIAFIIKGYRAFRIRQHKKTIPGPLLGVIYPETKKK
jgi:hypothetical protein